MNSKVTMFLPHSKLFRVLKMKTDCDKQQNDLTILNDETINQCQMKFKVKHLKKKSKYVYINVL